MKVGHGCSHNLHHLRKARRLPCYIGSVIDQLMIFAPTWMVSCVCENPKGTLTSTSCGNTNFYRIVIIFVAFSMLSYTVTSESNSSLSPPRHSTPPPPLVICNCMYVLCNLSYQVDPVQSCIRSDHFSNTM
jgi:hypothetical protein